ncbi:MAG: ATP-dependent helicase HrpB [Neomegalonema sp.]|nr:ATP-dependent helicase HrpB [Neomegalonema sp.]
MTTEFDLPIDAALQELLDRLSERSNVVLQAPPGAGKTTRVPLALLDAPWLSGRKILMLEPRRVAARAAAERLASSLGERVGARVGYRIRHESKISRDTRIEVVTEGILTRMLQGDPGLEDVGIVIFDEFHERSIHADLGLALCLESQSALREDLRLLVMSATLDGQAVAALLDAPIVTSEGRSFEVETRWLDAPIASARGGRAPRLEQSVAELTLQALAQEPGDALVFLPGAREIRGAESWLRERVAGDTDLRPLYGELPFDQQQMAIAPSVPGRRKVVLASAIAETSLTIDGVRIVVDGGRARRARFDPRSGMSRLVTEKVSKASATQRQGRAGRTAPGVCYRLWTKGEEGGLRAFDPPEILEADLAPVALELAGWGAAPEDLPFLDPPPAASYAQAVELLTQLGALDRQGRITEHGKAMAATPLHPRLAHMVLSAGGTSAALQLASLLEERDPLKLPESDIALRLRALASPGAHPAARSALERIKANAQKLKSRTRARAAEQDLSPGALLALAYPDRIGLRRKGDDPRYLLSGGKGAVLASSDALASQRLIVAADLDGDAREAKIRLAGAVSQGEVEGLFADQIAWVSICEWSKRDRAVQARERKMLGALALEDRIWKDVPPEALGAALTEGVRQLGLDALPWSAGAERLRARVSLLRETAPDLPDLCDEALLGTLEEWLTPHLSGLRRKEDLGRLDLHAILSQHLSWEQTQTLDRLAPPHFTAPTGTRAPIDYASDPPRIAIRLQELFGLTEHPKVGGRALLLDLLSPAQRPIQTTADLPGFWAGSYMDVRKDMRARYPRHPWPEDPREAEATRRTKPRGT